MSDFPYLTSMIVVPAAGALLVALVPRRRPELVRLVALVATLAAAVLTIGLLAEFEVGAAGFQFEVNQ
ncbi:MAG TPA: hypothetical protein VF640_06575, partial [Acidimicrobiales bacterium]